MGQRMNRRPALALLLATSLHGGLLAAAWWAITHTPPQISTPSPELIVAQWIPQAAPVPTPASAPTAAPQRPASALPPTKKISLSSHTKPDVMSSTAPASASEAITPPAAPAQATTPALAPTPANSTPVSAPPKPATLSPTPPRLDATQTGNPAPVYPVASKRLGEQGRVVLRIHVQADGTVGDMQLVTSSGFERLDESAMRAVKRWIYRPARQGDVAIAWWYQQPVTFTLETSNAN
jgi:periplasmic protein TonB